MTRDEAVNQVRNHILTFSLEDIQKEISKTFFQMDHVVSALYYGLTAGKNIILYGPGGFGKSQVVKKFIEIVNVKSQTIVGNEDTEVDALLGIPNIKKLTEHSVYEIAFERTVFRNPGILILEEFLDVRPATASALKDILSEGGLRQGQSLIESLISSVIICTNKNPDELSVDSSSSAFYKERFPIQIEVSWSSHSAEDYSDYLEVIKPNPTESIKILYTILAELAAVTSKSSIVSPRIVKDASDLLDIHRDIKVLRFVDGLDTLSIDQVIEYTKFAKEHTNLAKMSKNIRSWIDSLDVGISAFKTLTSISELEYVVSKLSTINVESAKNESILSDLFLKCKDTISFLRENLHGEVSEIAKERLNSLINDK